MKQDGVVQDSQSTRCVYCLFVARSNKRHLACRQPYNNNQSNLEGANSLCHTRPLLYLLSPFPVIRSSPWLYSASPPPHTADTDILSLKSLKSLLSISLPLSSLSLTFSIVYLSLSPLSLKSPLCMCLHVSLDKYFFSSSYFYSAPSNL